MAEMLMAKLTSTKVISIIPVYRDVSDLLVVLSKFNDKTVDEICVVTDCVATPYLSRIKAMEEKSGIPISIISREKRNGVGSAIRSGIQYALSRKYEVAVIMAGNNKDDPGEIPRLLAPIVDEGYDYIQGSRFLAGGKCPNNPLLRKVFSRLYPFIWTMITRVRCTDVTNGFRSIRMSVFSDSRIDINQKWLDQYQLEYYVHFKVLTLGYKTKEVPVTKTYPFSHKGGYSKISPFRDWWSIVGPLIYLALRIKT